MTKEHNVRKKEFFQRKSSCGDQTTKVPRVSGKGAMIFKKAPQRRDGRSGWSRPIHPSKGWKREIRSNRIRETCVLSKKVPKTVERSSEGGKVMKEEAINEENLARISRPLRGGAHDELDGKKVRLE